MKNFVDAYKFFQVEPIFHVVWHMFVVLVATTHWFAVYFYILHLPVV